LRNYCYGFTVIFDSKAYLSVFWREGHYTASLSSAHSQPNH
jgi:hypothetical protein